MVTEMRTPRYPPFSGQPSQPPKDDRNLSHGVPHRTQPPPHTGSMPPPQ